MRKIYSLALMAVMLLVSANGWANEAKIGSQEYAKLGDALAALSDETEITLLSDAVLQGESYPIVLNGKKVTLDLNGHNITYTPEGESKENALFRLEKGYLNITGSGNINNTIEAWPEIIRVYGSDNPADADYSVLTIGKEVSLSGFIRDEADASKSGRWGCYAVIISCMDKFAYGVKVTVDGKITATLPLYINGLVKGKEGKNIPLITVGETAEITAGMKNLGSAAIYAAGYAHWIIQGTLKGDNGIYAKSGIFEIDGAKIYATGSYEQPQPDGNGFEGNGVGIVYDSNSGYAGDMEVTIKETEGKQTIVSSTNGYAIEEIITRGEESKVDPNKFKIEGGSFTGADDKGALKTTATLQEGVKINGGITGGTYSSDISGYLKDVKGTITVVKDKNGKDLYTVSDTEGVTWAATLAGATKESYVKLDGKTETVSTDLEIAYLKVLGGSTVTVEKSLTVGGVIIDENSKLIVKPGAKLIVLTQGIVAFHEANLVLETQEGKEAILLLSPAVTGNTHPFASIEFKSKSWRKADGSEKVYDLFGIPTYGALTSIKSSSTTAPTAVLTFNNANAKWEVLGFINQAPAIDASKMNVPFQYYQFLTNSEDKAGVTITMTGQLVGIMNPTLPIRANSWNGYANSYIGNMDVHSLYEEIPAEIEKAVYLYYNAGDDANPDYKWNAFNELLVPVKYLKPMQPFLLLNDGGAANSMDLNYEEMVWNHKDIKYNAPARRKMTAREEISKVSVNVEFANGGSDMVLLAEDNRFSPAKDRGYDAVKYMNENINIYVNADQKMCVWATDELSNTYIGFSCVKAGTYTISFDCENSDENLVLTDLKTGKRVQIAENMTYQFEAEANTADDYRFLVSKAAKVTTAVEDVQEDIKAAGIYSITGQYLGAMSEWNNMPQGIYIVNGEKKIK